jgi:hypothetical protein
MAQMRLERFHLAGSPKLLDETTWLNLPPLSIFECESGEIARLLSRERALPKLVIAKHPQTIREKHPCYRRLSGQNWRILCWYFCR